MPNLFQEIKNNGLMTLALHGVRTVLENELGITPILIATEDTIKAEYKRRGHAEYPYAHIELNEVMGVRDQTSNRTMQRLGARVGLNGATHATTRRAYLFPITIGVALKYCSSDPLDYITMAETLAVLSMLGGISFTMRLNEDFDFQVRIEFPDSESIPIASREDAQTPGGVEIECALIVHTVVGFFRDIAAVNSDRPIVDYQIVDKTYRNAEGL